MDDLAQYNQARWEDLAQAGVLFSRPWLDLTPQLARERVDPHGVIPDNLAGRDVLCLASGGGQQSAAFALLGANVTVLDFSATQLQRDQETAAHYGLSIRTFQGDMRDLSAFASNSFNLVWHAYSINFVPDTQPVFQEVARVLRPGGLYRLMFANPFTFGLGEEHWNGEGYPLKHLYRDGAEVYGTEDFWDVEQADGSRNKLPAPREFRHILSTVINGLVAQGFILRGLWEELTSDWNAAPGTWEHFMAVAPPWLTLWATYQLELLNQNTNQFR